MTAADRISYGRELVGRIGIAPNHDSFRLGGLRTHVAAAAYLARVADDSNARPVLLVRIDDTNPALASSTNVSSLMGQLAEVGKVPLDTMGRNGTAWIVRQSERVPRYLAVVDDLCRQGLACTRADGSTILCVKDGRLTTQDQVSSRTVPVRVTRSDGSPLWHLASAVDDLDYHVAVCVRGIDKRTAEMAQAAIISALGGTPPAYYYLPRILSPDHSDRIGHLRREGFRDETLFAYIAQSLLNDDDPCLSFHDLMRRISVRSDFRSSVRLDIARLAKIERRVAPLMSRNAMAASLISYCRQIGDMVTSQFAVQFPIADLLAIHPRSLPDQYQLAASIAHLEFDDPEWLPRQSVLTEAIVSLQSSLPRTLDTLTAAGLTTTETFEIIRWILCGRKSGPSPEQLWTWHKNAGTLDRQLARCRTVLPGGIQPPGGG